MSKMNTHDLKRTLEDLLRAPETLHETLSLLYELAPLRHQGLQEALRALEHERTRSWRPLLLPRIALEIIKQALLPTLTLEAHPRTLNLVETLSYIDQLEQLLIDIELLTPLTPNLSAPEQLRRALMIEGVRDLITELKERRDHQRLDILAVASKKLGELLLVKPEGWLNEGIGMLLTEIALLEGGERGVWVEGMSDHDLLEYARWRPLLGALRRGAEGREVCPPNLSLDRIAVRVDEAVRAEVVYVAERMRLSGMVERRAVGDVRFGMVYCPPGEFWMGTAQNVRYGYENPRHEHPRHRVSLTRGVWMGQTQVTQELWEAVMGENPSYFKGAQRPVEHVSWLDCVRFCNKLSELEGLVPAYKIDLSNDRIVRLKMKANGYRLPTEAEWEYAAKSGTELMYSGGNSLDDVAWCWGNSERQTHPVAQKQANAWGIYDMTGNVMEWCSDSWSAEAYSGRISCEDPIEYNVHASKRVLRGGNFGRGPDRCRVACRHWCDFERRKSSFGFRLLRCEP